MYQRLSAIKNWWPHKNLRPGKNLRMFKSDFLEPFSYVHPIVPGLMWIPVVGYCLSVGLLHGEISVLQLIPLTILGFFVWTLAEYLLHRFVFHFKAKTPLQKRIYFMIHGVHHDDPEDERRLLMPPAAAIIIAIPFYSFYYFVWGPVLVNPFFAGFILGYLAYDYTHFTVHFGNPRFKFLKNLKQNHMKHHFVSPESKFGVSNTFWDSVFNTRG